MPSEDINNESFVSRWSRRKQDNNSETIQQPEELNEEMSLEELQQEKLDKLNALTDEDMPDVETLGEESDYAGFMSVNVSEGLRKLALQKLFHGKSYNIRDGLDEYDGDYTSFEKLDPSIITADMRHMMEVEAEKLLAKEQEKENEELAEVIAEESEELQDLDEGDDVEEEGFADEDMVVGSADVSEEEIDSDDDLVESDDSEEIT